MPMTATGSKVQAKFIKRYGKRGKNIFFATANSNKKFAGAMGEKSVWNRGHKS
jgi:hypothetical protein